jgi:hypothetical protein
VLVLSRSESSVFRCCQMVRSGQPTGLVVREIGTQEHDGYASVAHGNYDETQGQGDFILVRAPGE